MEKFNSLCSPAKIYAIITFVLIILAFAISIYLNSTVYASSVTLISRSISALICVAILSFLCTKISDKIAWVIVGINILSAVMMVISNYNAYMMKKN